MDKSEEKKYPEPVAGALIVNKDGKILLAKSHKWDGKYTIFGGHVELGEKLEDAVKREIKEESDLDVRIIGRLNFNESVFEKEFYKQKHFVFIQFLCEYDGDDDKVKVLDKEFDNEYQWVEIKEALKMNLVSGTKKIIADYIKYIEEKNSLDSWKRCQADFENYKKSQVEHLEDFRKYAKMDITLQILPVLDNFEASLAHVPEKNKENGWVEGIVYIKKQLEDVLKNNDISEIPVKIGEKFNPEVHEAVGGDGKKQKVAKIIQKGYRMNGRILRAVRVEVN